MGWYSNVCFNYDVAKMSQKKKLIVIGGGASGFFCAVNAARLNPDLQVIIIEKSNKLLSKVKVSGGGRCNLTHYSEEVADMIDAYPRGKNFMKKALYSFSSNETVKWFSERGVLLKSESDGRMFPVSDKSQTIIDCLMKEAEKLGVEIRLQIEVLDIKKNEVGFEIVMNDGGALQHIIHADFICIATGGHPKDVGFDWLRKIGLEIEPPVPSLFTFNIPDKNLHQLMGVANPNTGVKISQLKIQEQGPVLITHWGLSGPAILRMSARAAKELHQMNYEFEVKLNWAPNFHESAMLEEIKIKRVQLSKQFIGNKNPFEISSRLWNYILEKSRIRPDDSWANISTESSILLSKSICSDTYQVKGKTTFKEEFVTAGGVKLECINQATLESKKIPGLYFVGEVLNVDGITGGYNFQHAWASGWNAANAITDSLNARS